ncbi:SDR family oxidoreductase [Gordonia sp. TBRC 11910]|uniref:SDR family oxidoreductase n=1 Tax=Gordonia asplenii TaxID=2725283 RepID=A0A848L4T6_9ACTN|nr:SDR family oxidoreductase [Gordonia asplenii]NMO03613.1 SDR family oxidoreductase [Gordonia asplenii]
MSNKLDGRTALVTGSGRGIGREIALKLASEGANVVVNDLDSDVAAQTVADVETAGGRAVSCVGSVTDPEFADRFIATALETFGDFHVIVNNAGYTWDNVIQKMTDDQWDDILDVHLKAPFRILRAAQPHISSAVKTERADGRRVTRKVVNISSMAGTGGNAGQANYSAAKAGVIGLTKTLCKEWGRYDVTVNAVAYGLIRTRLTEAPADSGKTVNIGGRDLKFGVNPEILEQMASAIPLGRPGDPSDAAGAAYLFCAPESDYVSGQVLLCAGGFQM